MVKINVQHMMWLIVPLTLFVFFIVYSMVVPEGQILTFNVLFDILSKTVLILSVFVIFFVSIAWKWRVFKGWLVKIPNLNGKWKGKIFSMYTNSMMEIPVVVTIKQTFIKTTIQLKTAESESVSLVAAYDIDEERGIRRLIFTYQNDPKATVQQRSAIHYGTSILNIGDNLNVLEGSYFTSRETKGDIKLKRK